MTTDFYFSVVQFSVKHSGFPSFFSFEPFVVSCVLSGQAEELILPGEHLTRPGGPILFKSVPSPRSPAHISLCAYLVHTSVYFWAGAATTVSHRFVVRAVKPAIGAWALCDNFASPAD